MGLSHSPKVVTNGLVFYMDQDNTHKSWKGAPATNLFTETNLNNWSKSATTSTSAFVTPHGDPAYDITDSNSSSYLSISRSVTVANDSSSYTLSLFVRKTYGATSARLGFNFSFTGGTPIYINPRFNSDTGVATYGTVIDYGDWWYWYYTVTNNSTGNTSLDHSFYPATGIYNGSDNVIGVGTAIVGSFMLVAGSIAARFTNGTRSNTQAILDLTGQNTITATSLTYASNGSFSFNGSTDYITTNYVPVNTAGSINVWFKLNAHKDYNTIFDNAVGANDWEFWVYNSGIARFRSSADGTDYILDSDTLSINTWYNFTITWTSTEAKMYKNGVLYAQDTSVGTKVTPGVLYFAGGNAGNTKLNGYLPIAQAYNRALTAEEIQQNFNALRGRYGI